MKKVSIIVPIYNAEEYLRKCIDSLVNQTYENLEIILLNDGSTDKTEEIIKSYKDKRIIYIEKVNTGIGDTRNRGIDLSTGEYLMFVDSDDYIELSCVEELVEKLEKDNCDIVVSDYYLDTLNKPPRLNFFKDSNVKENFDFLLKINLGPCNKIYKSSIVKSSNNRFAVGLKYEDTPFVVEAICNAKKIGFVSICLFHYVIKSTGETITRDERLFDILKICELIENNLDKYPYIDKTSLIVKILVHYIRTSCYIPNKDLRKRFLKAIYLHLNKLDKNWKHCYF